MEFFVGLNGLDKSVIQILMQMGVVKDSTLQDYVRQLRVDFPDVNDNEADLTEILKRANGAIQHYSLNIRTVVMDLPAWHADANSGGDDSNNIYKQYYHGIANMEEDDVAKDYGLGTSFTVKEVELFTVVLQTLVQNGIMNMFEVAELAKNMTHVEVSNTIEKLESAGWLSRDRNERGYLEIGIRSYLELQSVIESATLDKIENEEDIIVPASIMDDDDSQDRLLAEQGRSARKMTARENAQSKLPQILIY